MSKLSNACYAIRAVKSFMSHKTLRMIYLSYVHSIMTYGIIFGGNSIYSSNIFKFQKRIIRVIMNSESIEDTCQGLLKKLNILSLQLRYIFSLLIFVTKNRDLYKSNLEIHGINTRHNTNLHPSFIKCYSVPKRSFLIWNQPSSIKKSVS